MSAAEKPRVTITRGKPSVEESAAVDAAIQKIWRDDLAEAGRSTGESAWVVSARAGGARTSIRDVRTEHAWALSLRFDAGPMTNRKTGAGGAH